MNNKAFTFEEIKQKLVNYCVYQDRCHYEVEQKTRDFLLIPEAKDEILLYLMNENYLNEERFVRSYIRGKFYIKSWGKNKIKQHLKLKQISEKLVNSCWDEIDDADYQATIKKLYTQYYDSQSKLKDYQKKIKTIRYLMTRGFEYDALILNINEDY